MSETAEKPKRDYAAERARAKANKEGGSVAPPDAMRTQYEQTIPADNPVDAQDTEWHYVKVLKNDDDRIEHFESKGYVVDEAAKGNSRTRVVMKLPKAVKQGRYLAGLSKMREAAGLEVSKADALNQLGDMKGVREGEKVTLDDVARRLPETDPEPPAPPEDLSDQ